LAGRTRAAAVEAFLAPLRQVLTCVTRVQLYVSGSADGLQSLTTPQDPVRLGTTGATADRLSLSIQHQFEIVADKTPGRGPWKVSTRGYRYQLTDDAEREIGAWHWHPARRSRHREPHLHVTGGRLHGCHLPTGRTSLEEIIRLLLAELAVEPLRHDWVQVLEATEAAFREWRTWADRPG
jgi:hypothetical protein